MLLNHKSSQLFLALSLIFSVNGIGFPQEPQAGQPAPDLIEQLRLTPEQRQKIRAIREQTKSERMAVNQRLRESNLALEQALDSDNLDESLVEQRIRELNAAQGAQLRMRIQNEVEIRRVLTPDQIATWRLLRQRTRDAFRAPNPGRRGGALGLPRTVAPR